MSINVFFFSHDSNTEGWGLPANITKSGQIVPSTLCCDSISDEEGFYWYALDDNFILLCHNINDRPNCAGAKPPTQTNVRLSLHFKDFPVLGDAYIVKIDDDDDTILPFTYQEMMAMFAKKVDVVQ